jgi:uncharacterized protein (DUF427 family)
MSRFNRPTRIEPGPGQESVWDYPRPPACVAFSGTIEVHHRGVLVATTNAAIRVLETSQPPAYYLPPDAVTTQAILRRNQNRTMCEWKGMATYWDLELPDGTVVESAAWSYEQPVRGFESITGHLAFYAQRLDRCTVNGEQADANAGSFYGGWITSYVVGPFKGAPGTLHW